MKFLSLVNLILLVQVNLIAQWYYQNPLPTGDLLIDVQFPSDSTGYAIGENSCIIKSVDAGKSWHIIKGYEENTWLTSLNFISDSVGYICGYGVFSKTTNGGSSWENFEELEENYTDVLFLNENIGFLISDEGEILRTIDGCVTWMTQQIDYPLELSSIDFINSDTAYCVGSMDVGLDSYEGKIYQTTNCGEDWVEINTGTTFNGRLYAIDFMNDSAGIALGDLGRIVYTKNRGFEWQVKELGTNIYLSSLCYLAPSLSSIIGIQENRSILLKSTSFFESWDQIEMSEYKLYSICSIGNESLCAVGINGTITLSENLGESWSQTSTNMVSASNWQTFRSVDFSDTNLGMIVGEKGRIIKTTDSGNNWSLMENDLENVFFTSSHFMNADTIVATSYRGIYLSTDGGLSWSNSNNFLTKDLVFLYDRSGFAVGENKLYRTQNGGKDWTLDEEFAFGENVSEILFVDRQSGYILGSHELFKTNNGGESWTKINMNNTELLNSFDFISKDTGFVVDDERFLYQTCDGGNSWNKFDLGIYGNYSIKFRGDTGIIVGDYAILKTEDLGKTWMKIPNITHNTLHSVELLQNGVAFAVGRGFTILRTDNYGGTGQPIEVSIVSTLTELEKDDQISIFPNPAKDEVVIQFGLSEQSIDHIRVINLEGKTIKHLEINKKFTSGQNIILNLAGEPAGIYLCIISINKKNKTYKIIKKDCL